MGFLRIVVGVWRDKIYKWYNLLKVITVWLIVPAAIAGIINNIESYDYFQGLFIGYALVLSISIIFFIFEIIRAVYREAVLEKTNPYGEIMLVLKSFFAKIHQLRKLDTIEPMLLKIALKELCDTLKPAYDKKTKSYVCVSIKLFEKIQGDGNVDTNASVYNLCRDKPTELKRNTPIYNQIQHTIFQNNSFLEIAQNPFSIDGKPTYYLNNNIPGTKNYKNTSKECYRDGVLPYMSELVVPLLPMIRQEDKEPDLLGFICLDSNKKNSFGTKYDTHTMQGVADGIYDVIMEWKFGKN